MSGLWNSKLLTQYSRRYRLVAVHQAFAIALTLL